MPPASFVVLCTVRVLPVVIVSVPSGELHTIVVLVTAGCHGVLSGSCVSINV